MRKFLMALALVLIMCETSFAESTTGVVVHSADGERVYYHLYDSGMEFWVGCGDDTMLSEDLRNYLSERVGESATVFGPVVDHPRFGFCVDSPALTETEPKADQADASAKLAEYDWITLPKDLTAEDREIIATSLTDTFWDPVYQVPVRTFAEVCRYFYDRGFTVDASLTFKKLKEPDQGTEGYHEVFVRVVNRENDMAMQLPLFVIYTCPYVQKEALKKFGDTGAKAFLYMPDLLQTDSYSQEGWRQATPDDWFVIMKSIIENGYVQEG